MQNTLSGEEEGSFLGLGYSHHEDENSTPTSMSSNAVDAADALMKHYLNQCLDYHEDQLKQQQEKAFMKTPAAGQDQKDATNDVPQWPQFVAAHAQQQPAAAPPFTPTATAPTYNSNKTCIALTPSAHEAIAKARAIVQKFQHPQALNDAPHVREPQEYSRLRHEQLQREQSRIEAALRKNFEYVAHRQEEKLQVQLRQLEQTRQVELELQQQHAQQLLLRKQQQQEHRNKPVLAGIGTRQRRGVERSKKNQGNQVASQNGTVALYLSGLPVDVSEHVLHQLFSSYGSIRRIYLYRNKQTKELKGDALLVYEAPRSAKDKETLQSTVCSQMNGAELPCGSILRVEPARSDYKPAAENDTGTGHYGPADRETALLPANLSSLPPPQEEDQQDDTEDLDDFFASL